MIHRTRCVYTIIIILVMYPNIGVSGKRDKPTRLRLLDDLMGNYTTTIRLQLKPTHIVLDPAIYGIVDIAWSDSLLSWNPSDYDNITTLRVLQSQIWVPDITIYQLLESNRQGGPAESFLTIRSDGSIYLSRTEQITFSCQFDVSEFPNDLQHCALTYVTWAYPSDEIQLTPAQWPKAEDSYFRKSSEWDLINYTAEGKEVNYGEDIGTWYELSYFITIQRKPFYYIITLTVPSFFITNLALLGVFSPSMADQQRSEKVSIGLTALLTMGIILMMVSDLMPKNASSFPKLGMYILWEMLLMIISTVLAVLLMYLHSFERFGRPMPVALRYLFFVGDTKLSQCSSRCSHYAKTKVSDVPTNYGSFDSVQSTKPSTPHFSQKLSPSEATIVGEKLATYGDDLLQGIQDNGSARIARRMIVVHRHILIQVNAMHEASKREQMRKDERKQCALRWMQLMFKLDIVGLVLTVGANCAVTYWFSGFWTH